MTLRSLLAGLALLMLSAPLHAQVVDDRAFFPIGFHGAIANDDKQSAYNDLKYIDVGALDSVHANVWQVHQLYAPFRSKFEQAARERGVFLIQGVDRSTAVPTTPGSYAKVVNGRYEAEDVEASCQYAESQSSSGTWPCFVPARGEPALGGHVGQQVNDPDARALPPSRIPTIVGAPAATAVRAPAGTAGRLLKSKRELIHYMGPNYPLDVVVRLKGVWPRRLAGETVAARVRARFYTSGYGDPPSYKVMEVPLSALTNGSFVDVRLLDVRTSLQPGTPYTYGWFEVVVETTGAVEMTVDQYSYANEPTASSLLAGAYDNAIAGSFGSLARDVTFRHYTVDEPFSYHNVSTGYVDEVVRKVFAPSYIPMLGSDQLPFLERFVQTVSPTELVIDPYTIGPCDACDGTLAPTPEYPRGGFNIAPYEPTVYAKAMRVSFDKLAVSLGNAKAVSRAYSTPFWYVPQGHGVYDSNTHGYVGIRPPSVAEARAQTWMGVAYGARGIMHFLYKRIGPYPGYADVNGRHASDFDPALDPASLSPVYTGYKTRWEGVRKLNAELEAVAPTLMRLSPAATYSTNGARPTSSFVGAITERRATAGDLHVGTFTGVSTDRYFVLVNRRTSPDDTRALVVRLEQGQSSEVTDVATGKEVARLSSTQTSFGIKLMPGEGRLLRVRSAGASSEPSLTSKAGDAFELDAVAPNPVRGTSRMTFTLEVASEVDLAVYDAVGRRVATLASGTREAGTFTVDVESRALAPGAYVVRLSAGENTTTQRMIVVR